MKDNSKLYTAILGLHAPWYVTDVELRVKQGDVTVMIEAHSSTRHKCPRCGTPSPGYDTRRRTFRHLDTCEYKTIIIVDVPRVNCAEHGVLQIDVPWAAPDSGFTVSMECAIIDWLLGAASPRGGSISSMHRKRLPRYSLPGHPLGRSSGAAAAVTSQTCRSSGEAWRVRFPLEMAAG
jgi:hypothetical protein